MPLHRLRPLAACAWLATAAPGTLACTTCGCTLNADWASQGIGAQAGVSLDLRHDFVDQGDLRSGTHRVDRASLAVPDEQEIQQRTVSQVTTLTLDDAIDEDWGVTVQLPWANRQHTTIAQGDTAVSTSDFASLGDARIMARYVGFSRAGDWGLQLGFKLPTGRTNEPFDAGPQAGALLDRGLQPGTGSTDLLLGIFRYGTLGEPHTSQADWFANALLQLPVAHDRAFRPSTNGTFTAGVRYLGLGAWVPQAQFNARIEGRESGAEADAANSGSTLVHFSPGLSWAATTRIGFYAFVQLPVYQRVNGLQLEPKWSASAGAHLSF